MPSSSSVSPPLLDWLTQHRVFGLLPAETRQWLARALSVREVPDGGEVCRGADFHAQLLCLLTGSVGLLDTEGRVLLTIHPGEWVGLLPIGVVALHKAVAVGPTRWVCLERSLVQDLRSEHPAMAVLLPEPPAASVPMQSAGTGESTRPAFHPMTTPVRALIRRGPVTLPPDSSIQAAARLMREQRVSSVMIVEQSHLFGVFTDRDLRNRVIATGMHPQNPIADIATLAPLSMDAQNTAFDALLLMARHNIHHVPVLDGQQIVGMVTANDLAEQHSTSAVYLVGDIHKQSTVEGLQRLSSKMGRLQLSLADAQVSAHSTGHIFTAVTDAITSRLIQLAEVHLGPAPLDYVWVAAGSQARCEQTARSDQDNCLVLDDGYDEARDGDYFKAFAAFVCNGLAACGYVHCPGDMMAMNATWRQPLRHWKTYFSGWLREPDPTALMLTCVFFDLRAIHGNKNLLEQLRRDVLQHTPGSGLFLTHLAHNALSHRPPLGLFKALSVLRSGEHKGRLDLKLTGVVPIVDLARVHALAAGDNAVGTHERLLSTDASGAIGEQNTHDLRDAFEFLAYTRIQHQCRQISEDLMPDNFLDPAELSNFERSQLKDAFAVVQSVQSLIAQRYGF